MPSDVAQRSVSVVRSSMACARVTLSRPKTPSDLPNADAYPRSGVGDRRIKSPLLCSKRRIRPVARGAISGRPADCISAGPRSSREPRPRERVQTPRFAGFRGPTQYSCPTGQRPRRRVRSGITGQAQMVMTTQSATPAARTLAMSFSGADHGPLLQRRRVAEKAEAARCIGGVSPGGRRSKEDAE